jgi:O-antigen/teichoic acid export membrane protein
MFASAGLFAVAGWLLHARSFGVARPRFAPRELGDLLVNAAPFFSILLLSVLYSRGGPILLGALGDRAELGAYAAADRILVAATLLPIMLGNAAYPALSRTAARSTEELRALTGRLLRLMLIGGLSSAGFLIAFANDLLAGLFGPHYVIAVPALQLLALSVPLQGAEQLVSGQLSAMGRQRTLVRIRSAALVTFLCLAPLAILRWNLTGLAATVLCCATLQLICGMLVLRRLQSLPLSSATVLSPFVAVAAVLALQWLASDLALLPRLLLFSFGLVAALWASRSVAIGDLLFLRAMFRNKSQG